MPLTNLRAAGVLLTAACAGCGDGGGGEPVDPKRALATVCVAFQEAMQAGDQEGMLELAAERTRTDLAATPRETIATAGRYLPEKFSIVDITMSADENAGAMTMTASGDIKYGRCEAVRENGAFRVALFDWSAQDPANRLAAGDPPETVVAKLHRTVAEAFDPGAASAFFTTEAKGAFAADPETMTARIGTLHQGAMPSDYALAETEAGAAEARYTLSAEPPAALQGEIVLQQDNGEWRVSHWSWGDTTLP